MVAILVSIGVTLFEGICVVVFFDTFLLRRRARNSILQTISAVVITALGMFILGYISQKFNVTQGAFFKVFASVLLFVVFALLYYKRSFPISISLSIILYFFILVSDYIALMITSQLSKSMEMVFTASPIQRSALAIAYKIGLFFLLLIIRAFCQRFSIGIYKNFTKTYGMWWFLFLLMPLLSIASIVSMVYVAAPPGYTNPLLLPVAFGWLVLTVVLFILLQILSDKTEEHQAVQMIAEHTDTEMKHAQTLSQINEEFHDYQNHLIWVDQLLSTGKVEEARQYLNTFPDESIKTAPRIHTCNEVIDAIVNQKYWLAKSKSIAILPIMNDLSNLPIEAKDLVAIVSNLLDNAIEACENVTNSPVIQLKILREEEALVIAVRNPVSANVPIVDNCVITSKTDKSRHGYGLMSIKRSLERYDAAYTFISEDMHFQCSAVIPL